SWRRAVAAFILPYLVVWCTFGAIGLAAESGQNAAMMRWPWLMGDAGILLALALALAAAWQLTPLKDACLRQCRSPVSFMFRYSRRGTGAALQLGFRHALFCFGCCWALMLVAVVAGMQHLWLMGLFALVMFAEKSLRWGPRIVRPVGTICGVTAA